MQDLRMGMPFYKLLVLSFSGLACTHSSNKQEAQKEKIEDKKNITLEDSVIGINAYDDIDLFNLKVVGKKEGLIAYPFIQIDSIDKFQKRIVYKISKKDSVESIYKKENNYWTTSNVYRGDTGYLKVFKYLAPTKIVEITYSGTWEKTGFHIADISLHEKDKIVTYVIHKYGKPLIETGPSADLLETYKSKAERVLTDEYSITDGNIRIINTFYDIAKNDTYYKDTSCYSIGDHSWFWWEHFGLQKRVNCK